MAMVFRLTRIVFPIHIAVIFAVAFCAVASLCPTNARADLRAGAAKVDITPLMGVSLDGSISKNGPATSVHDPLHARALVLSDEHLTIALVVVDQCVTGRDVFDAAKEKIHSETGIETRHMLMAATHTHAAPRTIHIGRGPLDNKYHEYLAEMIAAAVIQAHGNLSPAAIGHASFQRPELIACRRSVCEKGTVGKNPFGESGEQIKSVAGSSSKVIGPAGPVDPQFSILSVQHADGSPLCLLGNFSVHYCGGYQRGAVSADYFGQFAASVEASLESESPHPEMVAIMSNGTSGDTGAFQRGSLQKFAPFEGMNFYGQMLAEQAIKTVRGIHYRRDVLLKMVESEIELQVRRPDPQRLQWAKQVMANPNAKQSHRWTKIYAAETLHLGEYPATEKIKLQAIRIGDIGIAAAPCEVFAETGLAIKNASPIKNTFNMELANGYGGYLPSQEQHAMGGYETWPARSSKLEIAAEEKIRMELLRMLRLVAE